LRPSEEHKRRDLRGTTPEARIEGGRKGRYVTKNIMKRSDVKKETVKHFEKRNRIKVIILLMEGGMEGGRGKKAKIRIRREERSTNAGKRKNANQTKKITEPGGLEDLHLRKETEEEGRKPGAQNDIALEREKFGHAEMEVRKAGRKSKKLAQRGCRKQKLGTSWKHSKNAKPRRRLSS